MSSPTASDHSTTPHTATVVAEDGIVSFHCPNRSQIPSDQVLELSATVATDAGSKTHKARFTSLPVWESRFVVELPAEKRSLEKWEYERPMTYDNKSLTESIKSTTQLTKLSSCTDALQSSGE